MLSVAEAVRAAPSADNLQPIGLRYDGEALALRHRESRGPSFPARHPATLIAAGAAVENIAQATRAMELDAEITAPLDGDNEYARIRLRSPSAPVSTLPRPLALFQRHTNRHGFRSAPIPESTLVGVRAMQESGARIMLFQRPDEIRALAGFTRIASQARFRTPEIHAWLASSLRMTPQEVARCDGLDIRTLDLPPGGRHLLKYIADWRRLSPLNRIGAYRLLAAIEARPIGQAPLLIGVIAQTPFSAGRLMERVWIELNALGLGVQPYYVIPDQMQRLQSEAVPLAFRDSIRSMADGVNAMLSMARDESIQMILRVGWPTRKPVRSLRLPLDDLMSDDQSDAGAC